MTLIDLDCEIVKSTAAALIWASLGWLFLFLRNQRLEHSLEKTFGNHGITCGVEGVGITLKNPTAYEIIVREVLAQVTTGNFVLNYNGPKEEVNARGYVTLPPFSDGNWLISRGLYQFQKSEEFTAISVEFLYPSLFGSLKRVTIKGDEKLIDGFNKIRKQDEIEMPRLENLKQQLGR